jgi:hypothetical protein
MILLSSLYPSQTGPAGPEGATGPENTSFNSLSSSLVFSDPNLETETANLSSVDNLITLTETAYNNLSNKNPTTLYFIISGF